MKKITETFEEKYAIQHQERMSKRPNYRKDIQKLSTFVDKLDQSEYSVPIAIGSNITNLLKTDGYNPGIGGVEFEMYYNDTFLPNGKTWFEDIYHNYLKVVIECELGIIHMFLDQNGRIVLDLIQSNKPGSGNGSKLLTYFLDAIDLCTEKYKNKFECVCVPTAIEETDSIEDVLKITSRLRKFYMDFDFKPMSQFSPKLLYISK
jgi:hypothetical protein